MGNAQKHHDEIQQQAKEGNTDHSLNQGGVFVNAFEMGHHDLETIPALPLRRHCHTTEP